MVNCATEFASFSSPSWLLPLSLCIDAQRSLHAETEPAYPSRSTHQPINQIFLLPVSTSLEHSLQLFRTLHVIKLLRNNLKKLVSTHAINPIQFDLDNLLAFPEARTFSWKMVSFSLSIIQFSPSTSFFFSLLLHYSLNFHHICHFPPHFHFHTWNNFFVHCNLVYFFLSETPFDQGLVLLGNQLYKIYLSCVIRFLDKIGRLR